MTAIIHKSPLEEREIWKSNIELEALWVKMCGNIFHKEGNNLYSFTSVYIYTLYTLSASKV